MHRFQTHPTTAPRAPQGKKHVRSLVEFSYKYKPLLGHRVVRARRIAAAVTGLHCWPMHDVGGASVRTVPGTVPVPRDRRGEAREDGPKRYLRGFWSRSAKVPSDRGAAGAAGRPPPSSSSSRARAREMRRRSRSTALTRTSSSCPTRTASRA
jgi:hypothetical protein